MERYTSEQALNGILNILETVVSQQNRNESRDETSDMIKDLLSGVAISQKTGLGLGQQIEQIANGLDIIKRAGIDERDIENVATGITQLSAAVKTFADAGVKSSKGVANALGVLNAIGSVNSDIVDNINELTNIKADDVAAVIQQINSLPVPGKNISRIGDTISVLTMLGSLSDDVIRNINRLEDIDIDAIKNLQNVIKSLDLSGMKGIGGKQGQQNLANLQKFVTTLNTILGESSKNMSGWFARFRARNVGKTISAFYNEIFDTVIKDKAKIEMKVEGVGQMVQAIYPLISEDSNMSVKRMKEVLTKENGQQIGGFFKEIIKVIPDKKKTSDALNGVSELLKLITAFGIKDYIKIKKILTTENGKQIGGFFAAIFKEIEGKKIPDIKPINEFLKVLSGIGVTGAIGLMALKPVLTEKFGKQISSFFKALISGITKDRLDKISEFTKSVKTLSTAMLMMASTIGIMAAEIAFFGVATVLESLTVTSLFVGVTIMLMKTLGKSRGDIMKGTSALKEVMKSLTLLSLNVVILAATASMLQDIDENSLFKLGGIITVLGLITGGAMWLSDKWQRGGDKALKTMAGVSILLVSTSVAVGIAAMIGRKYDEGEIAIGLGSVAAVIIGGFIAVSFLEKANKDFNKAIKTLGSLVAIMATTALVLNFIIAPLGNKVEEVAIGGVVVMATIALMTGITQWLSKISEKYLDKATLTLAKITAIFGAISLVAMLILPTIGEKWPDVKKGAFAVGGIILIMTVITGLIGSEKLQKDAANALITMGSMTAIFAIISLVAATLLIPIGRDPKNLVAIGIGLVAVGGIIFVMMGITRLLGKPAYQKNVANALITMGVLTVILGAVSLIATVMLPKIGEQWPEALDGMKVVVGIIGAMALITWGLHNLVKNTNIKQAYLTLGVLTVMLGAVAYITDEFLIPIGYEAPDAKKGSLVVLGVIAAMGTMVWLLGRIDKENLIKGAVALVAIEAIIWSLDKAFDPYLGLLDKISGRRRDILKGSAAIAVIIGGWGAIMGVLGKFANKFSAQFAVGAATIAGIGGVLWALSEMLPSYLDMTKLVAKDWTKIDNGNGYIVLILGAWGLIFGALGSIVMNPIVAGVLAAGAAAVTGISAVMFAIGKMMPSYVSMSKLIVDNWSSIKRGGKILPKIFSSIGKILGTIGLTYINPLNAIALKTGSLAVKEIGNAIRNISNVVTYFVRIKQQIDKNGITLASIKNMVDVFSGKGGLADAITDIISKLSKVGWWSAIEARFIAGQLRPVFDMLSTFIDVIHNTLNLRYVTEWDKDGKPVAYGTVKSEQLGQAGTTISKAFGVFLRELGKGMRALKGTSMFALQMMSLSIGPIMKSVGTFANAITSVMSKGIADQWDENGKATHFKPFNETEFKDAAVAISSAFGTFLETLGPHLEKLSNRAVAIVQQLGKGVLPVMQAVSTFTDMVTGILVGKEMTFTDSTGKQVTDLVKIDPTKFSKAGTVIADAFKEFIEKLWAGFNSIGAEYEIKHMFKATEKRNRIVDIINSLQNIGTIIEAVDSFIDLIAKTVENKKKYGNLGAQGKKLAAMLINFVAQFQKSFKTDGQRKIVQNISDCMGDVDTLIKKSGSAYKRLNSIFEKGIVVTIEDVNKMFDIMKVFGSADTIKMMKAIRKRDVAELPAYFNIIHKAAKTLNKLPGLMTDPEITTAITAFLKDIQLLTQADVRDDVAVSRRAMTLFNKDLRSFSTSIERSRKFVIKFTSSMSKATKALREFDDGIIKREQERNAALKSFADMVQNIADSVESLKTQIEALDENKIVSSFKGISSVIEMAKSITGGIFGGSDNESQLAQQTSQTRQNTSQAPAQQTTVIPAGGFAPGQKMMITMNFPTGSLTGFAELSAI